MSAIRTYPFPLTLDTLTTELLRNVAQEQHRSRNAVIKEAVKIYLDNHIKNSYIRPMIINYGEKNAEH